MVLVGVGGEEITQLVEGDEGVKVAKKDLTEIRPKPGDQSEKGKGQHDL